LAPLVESELVLQNVIGNLRLTHDVEWLRDRTSVTVHAQSALIEVSVEDGDRQRAVRLAQEISLVFSQLVKERFSQTPSGATATVFDPAHADEEPVSPRPVRTALVALALGLVLGLLAAYARDALDPSFRDRRDVEKQLGAPVLAEIRSRDAGASFGDLHATLRVLGETRPLQTILFADGGGHAGTARTAVAFASALQDAGASVVLVDANLREASLDALLARSRVPGLAEVAGGSTTLESALQPGPPALLAAGAEPPVAERLLGTFAVRDVLEQLGREYDYVLVVGPSPVVPGSEELAAVVDGVVLVLDRATSARPVLAARSAIDRVDGFLAGVVLARGRRRR
jgi:receptor protein-tyrosine kinase